MSTVSADVLKDLAPTGTLRASINMGNIVLANGTPDNPGGVTPELARELAKRLGVPSALTCFDAAGKAFDAMKAGKVDIVFLAIEPVRAAEIEFTAPYVIIEGCYIVPKDFGAEIAGRCRQARHPHRREPALRIRPVPHAQSEELPRWCAARTARRPSSTRSSRRRAA